MGVAAKEGKEGEMGGGEEEDGPEGGAKGGGLQTQRSDVKGEGETKGRRDDTTVVRAVCMVPLRPRAKRKNLSQRFSRYLNNRIFLTFLARRRSAGKPET